MLAGAAKAYIICAVRGIGGAGRPIALSRMLAGFAEADVIGAFVRISSAGRPIRSPCAFPTVIIVRGGASIRAAVIIVYAAAGAGLSRMLAVLAEADIICTWVAVGSAGRPIRLPCTFPAVIVI